MLIAFLIAFFRALFRTIFIDFFLNLKVCNCIQDVVCYIRN